MSYSITQRNQTSVKNAYDHLPSVLESGRLLGLPATSMSLGKWSLTYNDTSWPGSWSGGQIAGASQSFFIRNPPFWPWPSKTAYNENWSSTFRKNQESWHLQQELRNSTGPKSGSNSTRTGDVFLLSVVYFD